MATRMRCSAHRSVSGADAAAHLLARRSPVQGHGSSCNRTGCRLLRRSRRLVQTALTDTVLSTGTSIQNATQPVVDAGKFVWTRCWYPVLPLVDLDASKPTPVTLLNKRMVLWQDAAGHWRCFEDACPHRLAPLSEGRIERDGDTVHLACSYHGWQFGSDGRCTTIPQSEDPKAEATACASQRSCAKSYPTQEAYGLLWVWPDASPNAALEAAAASPVVSQRVHDICAAGGTVQWYHRELPYGYEVLVENLTDPSHFPYSHHKLNPMIDRKRAKSMPLSAIDGAIPLPSSGTASEDNTHTDLPWPHKLAGLILPAHSAPGIAPNGRGSSAFSFPSTMTPHSAVTFNPPSNIVHVGQAGPASFQTELLAVPTTPGHSQVFNAALNNMPAVTLASIFKAVLKPSTLLVTLYRFKQLTRPTWQSHLAMNKLFDQDGIFLAKQDAALSRSNDGWAKRYFMPTSADACVIAARKWMDSVGDPHGGAGLLPRESLPSMEQTLDRAAQHTAHCRECRQAQRVLQQRLAVARSTGVVAFAALCAVLAAFGPRGIAAGGAARLGAVLAVGTMAVCGVVVRHVSALLPQFSFVPFFHHNNN